MNKRLLLKATASAAATFAAGCVQTVPRVAQSSDPFPSPPPSQTGPAPFPSTPAQPAVTRRELGGLPTPQEQQRARDIFEIAITQPGATQVLASLMELNEGQDRLVAAFPTLRTPQAKSDAIFRNPAIPVRNAARALTTQLTGAQGVLATSGVPRVTDARFEVPPASVARFDLQGFCMDFGLPPPEDNDALFLIPARDRVPPELWGLYQALLKWMSRPGNQNNAQAALWTLTGAGTSQYLAVYPYPSILRAFDEAMPGGAEVFRRYHEARMGPIRQAPQRERAPEGLGDPSTVSRLLDGLVAQGRMLSTGQGVGYAMLEPDIAARGVGIGRLNGHYQIVNATNRPYAFDAKQFLAAPAVKKQAVSGTTTVSNPAYAEPAFGKGFNPAAAADRLRALAANLLDFIRNPVFGGQLDWMKEPFRADVVMDRGLDRLKDLDQRYPIKAIASAAPVLGNALAMYEAATGRDWLYDRELTNAERAISALSIIPGEGTLKLGLAALDRAGALSKVASLAGSSNSAERVRRAVDSVVDSVYFNTLYGTLQPLLRAQRTDTERIRWDTIRAGGDPSAPLSLSQDPANLLTWLADKTFRLETGIRDAFESVATGRVRLAL